METFVLIGGDLRYTYLAGSLTAQGYTVIAVGFENTQLPENVVGCTDVTQAVDVADVVVLPMPLTTDGLAVRAPFARTVIPLEQVYAAVRPEQLVVGGGIGEEILTAFQRRGCEVQDYLKREELAVRNAVPTAEGALQLAMEELPITINGASCLITGYGRIARVLASRLIALGASVTVAARKCEDRAHACTVGCRAVSMAALCTLPPMDVVFNTVPSMLFDRRVLETMVPHTLLIDLASRPGGVDFDAAAQLHLKTVWALSLPGRVAPKTAGDILGITIMNILSEVTK